MFEAFSRSWEITKQTFKVIKSDKEILLFPVLSSVFSIIFFVVMAVPFLMTNIVEALGVRNVENNILFYIVLFVLYLGISFIATFFNVGVVYCAKKRFEGKDPTFSEGLKEAFKRIHLIFMWALVSATVGIILSMIENAAQKSKSEITRIILNIARSILGAAWSIVSIFVVPAMVFDNVGPFEALKKSANAVKKTWGESLIRHFGLGWAQTLFILAGLIILVPGLLLLAVVWQIGLLLIGLFAIYLIVVLLVFSAANTIFNTALYMYAEKGKIPSAYTHDSVKYAFEKQH